MRGLVLVIFCLLSRSAPAQIRAPVAGSDLVSKLPFSVLEHLSIQGELETIRKVAERIKAGDRSVCPDYLGPDMSGCADDFLRTYRIHSAQALRGLLDLTVAAGLKDQELGFTDRAALLRFAQAFLTAAEKVRPQKFFAATIRARTKADRTAKHESKRWQNECLRNFRQQALSTIESYLKQIEAKPLNPDSKLRAQEAFRVQALRSQLAKLRVRKWSLS